MVIAGKEDFGNNLSNFGKKFLWSRVLTNLDRALLRPRPNDTIICYSSSYDELLLYHCYLPIYIHATCRYYLLLYMYIGNIYIMIYMYMYICVCVCMCYAMMCYVSHDACVHYTVLSCFVQPACLCVVGWHRCLTVYTYSHIMQTIAPHLLHYCYYYTYYTIYILQLYTYQIRYLFTLYCVMWRGYVIHQLLYILHYAILCVYMPYSTMIYDYGL